jgi:hypothetical protein
LLQESYSGAKHKEIEVQKNLKEIQHVRSIFCFNDSCNVMLWNNPFWDSKPKLFSDICLPPKKRSRDILSKQVNMTTFNGSEAAAGNDELYLAS